MRHLSDLTPEERQAYQIYKNRLANKTFTAAQHDEARKGIDDLLWKGPNHQVKALRAEVEALSARVERLEFHAGLNDACLPDLPDAPSEQRTIAPAEDRPVDVKQSAGLKQTVDATVTPAPDVPQVTNSEEANAVAAKETRGRKKLRFIPEKDAAGGWRLLDRDQGEYLDSAPFKTRKEAKVFTDDLNAGIKPKFLRGQDIPGLSDEVVPHVNDDEMDAEEFDPFAE